jgi:O-antigen ligase
MNASLLLVAFTFLVGYELCLPVVADGAPFQLPFIATTMNVLGGFSVKELILLLHALLNINLALRVFGLRRPPALLLIYLLFFFGAMVSIAVNGVIEDVPEAGRFLAAGYYIFAVRAFIEKRGVEPLVLTLLCGLVLSMSLNLYLTFAVPRGMLGVLPLLYGQNGPGGFAGASVGLLFLLRDFARHRATKQVLALAILLALVVVILSYSKLGMSMAIIGAFIWANTMWSNRRSVVGRASMLVVLSASALGAYLYVVPSAVREQAGVIYEFKFYNEGGGFFDAGDRTRWAYYLGVGEIIVKHPLGVSYRGIGSALQQTEAERSGYLPEEESLISANPHNSFLYYMAANGFIGWAATLAFFGYFMRASYSELRHTVSQPLYYTALVCGVCVMFANTLPTFFNVFFFESILLYMVYGRPPERAETTPTVVGRAARLHA